jgi:hypothetical protein
MFAFSENKDHTFVVFNRMIVFVIYFSFFWQGAECFGLYQRLLVSEDHRKMTHLLVSLRRGGNN